ncbi:hypothetical protein Q9189_002893 [Teloschistes chrysophthalmus]
MVLIQSPKPLPVPLAMSRAVPTTTSTSTAITSDQPTPSPLPVHASSKSQSAAPRPHPKAGFPTCKLRIECHDLAHNGAHVFFSNNQPSRDLASAVSTVLSVLYKPSESNSHIPPVRSVTFILRAMDILAYTTGSELDNDHKELHFNLDYVEKIPSMPENRQRDEIHGVIVHEMVHCWQWNGHGTAPSGLIEGIADFVRLKAGLSPPHWKRERSKEWDAGYQHTGYFLDWIETLYGEGSVRRINEALMNKKYNGEVFWVNLFGKHVQELWDEYNKTLPERNGEGTR